MALIDFLHCPLIVGGKNTFVSGISHHVFVPRTVSQSSSVSEFVYQDRGHEIHVGISNFINIISPHVLYFDAINKPNGRLFEIELLPPQMRIV